MKFSPERMHRIMSQIMYYNHLRLDLYVRFRKIIKFLMDLYCVFESFIEVLNKNRNTKLKQ